MERYRLLEDVWLAHLGGEDYPDSFSLMPDEVVRSWGKFDLVSEARFIANRRSGLRFRDAEPSMALLLIQSGRLNARSLSIYDSKTSGKVDGIPFPSTYDQALVDAADRLPELDGDKEVSITKKGLASPSLCHH